MQIITQTDSGTYHVTLHGQFTFNDNPEFRTILETIPDPGVKQIVFHLEHLDFVDSAALGMLLLARDEAQKHAKSLVLQGANGQVKRIFEMARFGQFFKFI